MSSGAGAIGNETYQGAPKTEADDVRKMLEVTPGNLTVQTQVLRRGHASDDRGLKYQIEGRATKIEVDIGNSLATYQDPIKAMFSTRICEGQKVQVFRKYVVGGAAVPTPERAPARIVKVQEDMKEVMLTRYGADLTMNLNLLMRPADAQQELQMKVDVQKQSLENELTKFGYEELMKGTKIGAALARSKGIKESQGGNFQAYMKRVHKSMFAAFQRHEHPLTTLTSIAKSCTAYRNVIGANSLMILPHASPEMLEYGKYNKMTYNVNGVKSTDKKPLTVAVDSVYDDPTIGLKLMVHHPPHSYNSVRGQVAPHRGESALFRTVTILDEVSAGYEAVNFATSHLEPPKNFNRVRVTKLRMGSAVIGVPGENTGELLVGYPFTATSTNQRTESMCVSLRVYLGAVLKSEDQVIVFPDVYIDHVESCQFVAEKELSAAEREDLAFAGGMATHYNGGRCVKHGTSIMEDLDTIELAYLASGINLFEKRIKLTKPIECDEEAGVSAALEDGQKRRSQEFLRQMRDHKHTDTGIFEELIKRVSNDVEQSKNSMATILTLLRANKAKISTLTPETAQLINQAARDIIGNLRQTDSSGSSSSGSSSSGSSSSGSSSESGKVEGFGNMGSKTNMTNPVSSLSKSSKRSTRGEKKP